MRNKLPLKYSVIVIAIAITDFITAGYTNIIISYLVVFSSLAGAGVIIYGVVSSKKNLKKNHKLA